MGYVIQPIPFEVLRKMPPEIRAQAIAQEREFMLRLQSKQGATASLAFGIVGSLVILVALLFLI